jgi:hypothetical protein
VPDQDRIELAVTIDDEPHAGPGRSTVLHLTWDPSDPFAVALLLVAQPEHPALSRGEWVVLRDFLHYGLEEPTGDGIVRIRPDEARDRVWLELERYGRPACVSLPRETVRAFLRRTEALVPCGEERSEQALEILLDRLLS